jgi:hypothetical protein
VKPNAIWVGMLYDEECGHRACGADATRQQIERIAAMPILIPGMDAAWLREEMEPIAQDRAVRIDRGVAMNCRPRFAIVWHTDDGVVRIEAYAGYNQLRQEIDYAAPGFEGSVTYTEREM